ncbi:MAG: hypothetical protein Q7U06_01420 [Pseudomonadota bacterium]|nr:hypothetical protein [Pseudomonadota bacterium]
MYGYKPYVPVAQRRAAAQRHAQASSKNGVPLSPVVIAGRLIATSFWGKAWCAAMESYGDYANRLPRGRTYARNGSVVDLRVEPGLVSAAVSGSELYRTTVRVTALPSARWRAVVDQHAAQVSSLVDLLQGKLPASLLAALSDRSSGLFPGPTELKFACSCPDMAMMCKHVAAVLYGVGARLDHDPGLFFVLRGVDASDLAVRGAALGFAPVAGDDDLVGMDLGSMFGIDLGGDAPMAPAPVVAPAVSPKPVKAAPKPAPVAAAPAKGSPKSTKAATNSTKAATKPAAVARVAAPPVQAAPAPPPKPASRPAKAPPKPAKKPAGAKPLVRATMSSADLDHIGIDRDTVASWLGSGVLLATPDAGVYMPTADTGAHLRAYLVERRAPS